MAYDEYSVEGKYKCNHPESDFVSNSNGPIEMKKENFVEYTHRNETANYQYDVWNNSNNTVSANYSQSSRNYSSNYNSNSASSNSYSQNKSNYASRNPYNYSTNKKKSSGALFWIIFVLFFLPGILSAIFEALESFVDVMY